MLITAVPNADLLESWRVGVTSSDPDEKVVEILQREILRRMGLSPELVI
jgi:hypothetical protein